MLHISLSLTHTQTHTHTHTHTHTLSLSLSRLKAFHRSWLSIFLFFSRQPNRILDSNFLLFSLQLGIFFPYPVILLVDFELKWFLFLFLNLKCYEFVVFCIACFHCDCWCIGSSAQWMVKESSNFTICGIESKSVSWWVSEYDSASLAISEPNIEEEEAKVPTASSQSKTMSCSKIAKHKTHLKCNGVVSH